MLLVCLEVVDISAILDTLLHIPDILDIVDPVRCFKTEHCTYKALILEYSHSYIVSCKYLFKKDKILCVTSV